MFRKTDSDPILLQKVHEARAYVQLALELAQSRPSLGVLSIVERLENIFVPRRERIFTPLESSLRPLPMKNPGG